MTRYNEVNDFMKRLLALEKIVRENNGAPRASYTAIHDGGISEYDEDFNLVSRLGTQHDGTHGAVDLNGPVPPDPTDPALGAAAVTLSVTWDGHVVDELGGPRPLPLDFQCVQILAKLNSPPDLVGSTDVLGVITSEAGGSKSLTVGQGTWHVALRTRAKSGRVSGASSVVTVVVPSAVDVSGIEADIAAAQADANAAVIAATEALFIGSKDNMTSDPNFATLGTATSMWGPTSANVVADPTGGRAGGTSLKIVMNGVDRIVTSEDQWTRVEPEFFYRISLWVKPSVELPAGSITACVEQKNASGSVSYLSSITQEDTLPSATWTLMSTTTLEKTAADTVAIRPVVRVEDIAGASGNIWFDQVGLYRAVAGKLLVDGQIETKHLGAEIIMAENIAGATITGDKFAGEILLGSKILTSESGQRVEIDRDGIRLYDANDAVKVNLPAAEGEIATFQGQVQADNLTVHDGGTFYAWNEFARGSFLNLAEQIAGPVATPTPTVSWPGVTLERTSYTGALGTFKLNMAEVVGVGRDFSSGGQRMLIMQQRSGGTRMWYYNMDGTVNVSVGAFSDFAGYQVTGAHKTDSLGLVWFGQRESNGVWYFKRNGSYLRYQATSEDSSYRIAMSSDATSLNSGWYVCEKVGSPVRAYRFREVGIPTSATSQTNLIENMVTGDNDPSPYTPGLAFVFRGNADFGANRWVVAQQDSDLFRTFSSGGTYLDQWNWRSPAGKVGAFWDAATSKFYTLCDDGVLYAHSSLTWTDSSLDTWWVGQSYIDSNATGGTHETALGSIKSFTMRKRAEVTFSMVDVPAPDDPDDPDSWGLYVKRGTAPSGPSQMWRQATGAYTVQTTTMTAAPVTSGTAALSVGTFSGASPAKLRSGRAMPSDANKPIIELNGDGSGRFGTYEVSNLGVVVNTDDTGWVNISPSNPSNYNTSGLQARRVGNTVEIKGRVQRTAGDWNNMTVPFVFSAAIPSSMRPATLRRVYCASDDDHGARPFRVVLGTDGVMSALPSISPTGADLYVQMYYFVG